LRILWQNEHFPDPIKGGGGAVNTKYIVNALNRLGHETTVLARGPIDHFPYLEDVGGIAVLRMALPSPPGKLWPIWPVLEPYYATNTLTDLAKSYDAFVGIDTWFALAIKRLYPDKRLVYRIEGSQRTHDSAVAAAQKTALRRRITLKQWCVERFCSVETALVEQRAWKASDATVVKSEFMKTELQECYSINGNKIHVIPNGVDYEKYAGATVARDILAILGNETHSKVIITSCGRLVPVKNVSFLLKAFALMKCKQEAIVTIVGEGEQREALQKEARTLGVADQTRFVGYSSEVEKFLAAADIFVLPSVNEAFGNALIEAMAAGVACVALRPDLVKIKTASNEILTDDENGFLVAGDSPNELSAKLDYLVCNPDVRKRIGKAAQETCKNRYNWTQCAAQYLELLSR
jgi:glycosyltransferase involved in cell wall biosynthesis